MDFDELYKKYQQLLKENRQLKAIIEAHRSRSKLPDPDSQIEKKPSFPSQQYFPATHSDDSETVHIHSAPEAKIALFLALFRGRDDVYAKRWQNRAGKSGYSPVCLNE